MTTSLEVVEEQNLGEPGAVEAPVLTLKSAIEGMSLTDMVRALREQFHCSLRVALNTVTDGWRPGDPIPVAAIEAANAQHLARERLRDAAPQLLEALEEFSREYDGFENGDGEPCATLKKARAAIAQATGEGR